LTRLSTPAASRERWADHHGRERLPVTNAMSIIQLERKPINQLDCQHSSMLAQNDRGRLGPEGQALRLACIGAARHYEAAARLPGVDGVAISLTGTAGSGTMSGAISFLSDRRIAADPGS